MGTLRKEKGTERLESAELVEIMEMMETKKHTKVARALPKRLMFVGGLVGLIALVAIGCSSSDTASNFNDTELAPIAGVAESISDIDSTSSLLHNEADDHAGEAMASMDDTEAVGHDLDAATLGHEADDNHAETVAINDDHEAATGEGVLEITLNVIEGRAWGFDPDVIEIPVGRTVRLTLVNDGRAVHDVEVAANMEEEFELVLDADSHMAEGGHHDAGSISAHAVPGTSATVTFTALHVGEYEFSCTLPGHKEAGMIGKLIVVPELEATNLEANGPTS